MSNHDNVLSHHGVKGMKWGVRKAEDTPTSFRKAEDISTKRTPEERRALAKKIAIGVGILAVTAGATYAGYTLSKNSRVKVNSLNKKIVSTGAQAAQKVLEEPTQLIHFSKPSSESGARTTPLRFIQKGGMKNFFGEVERFENMPPNTLVRYGTHGEKIAVNLLDPKGRHDAAGRKIDHVIIIPKSLTPGINTIDDVLEKIWPVLEYDYEEMVRQHIQKERS